ncbi:MAG: hypothetical protein EA351_14895 [Gemmatimonadales bacterium]|nr:MAG: hypothetical protein EA351_14895 [Gemmatimonadales bacterium]
MTPLQLLVLGFVTGANNLAVALAIGALRESPRRVRIIGVFAVFEFLVPLLGVAMGRMMAAFVDPAGRWIAAGILVVLGVWTVVAGIRREEVDEAIVRRLDSYRGLLLLGMALSVDNLIVGFSFGLREFPPVLLASVIATFSAVFALVGIEVGRRMRRHWEGTAAIAAGLLLIGLGVATTLGWL